MISPRLSGTWKQVNSIHTKINGVWKQVNSVHVKVSGLWKNSHTGGGDRGILAGGGLRSHIEYITITTPGNSLLFGYSNDGLKGNATATSNSSNGRGIIAFNITVNNKKASNISYITISTPSNSLHFGYLTTELIYEQATSNGTNNRGVFMGGDTNLGVINLIQYITISTPGNAVTFGYLTERITHGAATSNGINDRGVLGGGTRYTTGQPNRIDYITISTPSNASYFGSLRSYIPEDPAACSNLTNNRGLFSGGANVSGSRYNEIHYITISTLGNGTFFASLMGKGKFKHTGTSNGTRNRGIFWGGDNFSYEELPANRIEYVTITTPANAVLFGYSINTGDLSFPGSTSDGG